MTTKTALDYLQAELDAFNKVNDSSVAELLELTISQITFIQLVNIQMGNKLDAEDLTLIRCHLMTSLQSTARIAGITGPEVDRVVKKSMELVDCMSAMTDPTRTNLH